MPTERPTPPPFEPEWLDRSLDRYLTWGLVFMVLLIGGFVAYTIREPTLRADAAKAQQVSDIKVGNQLFADNCASCHGKGATGGSAPRLDAKEFLKATTNDQVQALIEGGVSGTEMPAWSLDYGGTLSDQQIAQVTAWLRSLEASAPSVPAWRSGKP